MAPSTGHYRTNLTNEKRAINGYSRHYGITRPDKAIQDRTRPLHIIKTRNYNARQGMMT
jgi:hypothetical protein